MQDNTDLWKSLITLGNEAFEDKDWQLALSWYEKSQPYAYEDCQMPSPLPKHALTNVLITHFNIADTYIWLQQPNAANEQFTQCFQFLEQILARSQTETDLQNAVIHAYSQSRTEWMLFKERSEATDPAALQRIETALHTLHTSH